MLILRRRIIVTNGNIIEYTYPARKILRWSEQKVKNIRKCYLSNKKIKQYLSIINLPVYRGLGKEGSKYFSSLKKGDKITEKSFLSSSLDEDVAELFMNRNNGNTILIIEYKSGVSIANISQSGFEGEILLKSDRTFIIENKTFKPRFDESDPLIQEIYLKEIE